MNEYTFEYCDIMKRYREKENICNRILSVELKSKTQLRNKRPKFIITLDTLVYEGTPKETNTTMIVTTIRNEHNQYIVTNGSGQFTGGIISKLI